MLSKEELKVKNTKFWSDFRRHMNHEKSVSGRQLNWINYPTEIKDIYLRMEYDHTGARLCFDIQPKNDGVRSIVWEQMEELKKVLEDAMKMETVFNKDSHEYNGRKISRIQWEDNTLNFFNDDDSEKAFEFFKNALLKFDGFYQEYKDILILLMN